MPAYFLSQAAEEDLVGIYLDGLTRWGEAQADSYTENLYDAFGLLGEQPQLGVVRPELGEGLRSFPQGAHIIIYMISDKQVAIVRVLDQRMKLENWL